MGAAQAPALVHALPKNMSGLQSTLGGAGTAGNRRREWIDTRGQTGPGVEHWRGGQSNVKGCGCSPRGCSSPHGHTATGGTRLRGWRCHRSPLALPAGGIVPSPFPSDGSHQQGMLFIWVPIKWFLLYHKLDYLKARDVVFVFCCFGGLDQFF